MRVDPRLYLFGVVTLEMFLMGEGGPEPEIIMGGGGGPENDIIGKRDPKMELMVLDGVVVDPELKM